MIIDLTTGRYVLAVSGGVDSVVLLDLLAKISGVELIIAHFDHGIRADSNLDAEFVEELARKYKIKFYLGRESLGPDASEAMARTARYKFLNRVVEKVDADAIVTAHHQDDLIETAILNIMRGTTARGLGSLKSTNEVIRPLLEFSKSEITEYAKKHNLKWREDESNQDQKYLRNYIRHNIASKMSVESKQKLLKEINKSVDRTKQIDQIINDSVDLDRINRTDFVVLPHSVSLELVAAWLRQKKLKIDTKTVERLVVSLKTARPKTKININSDAIFVIENGKITLKNTTQY